MPGTSQKANEPALAFYKNYGVVSNFPRWIGFKFRQVVKLLRKWNWAITVEPYDYTICFSQE